MGAHSHPDSGEQPDDMQQAHAAALADRSRQFDWHGFAAADTLPLITERLRILLTGRRFAATRQLGDGPIELHAGLRLNTEHRLGQPSDGIIVRTSESWPSITVDSVYPNGRRHEVFGISTPFATEAQARATAQRNGGPGKARDVTWVTIEGGNSPGACGSADLIEVEHINGNGVRVAWTIKPELPLGGQERAERDASLLEELAAALNGVPDPSGLLRKTAKHIRYTWPNEPLADLVRAQAQPEDGQ